MIRAVLSNLIGEDEAKDIEIISNDVTIHADGKWDLRYRHPTRFKFSGVICKFNTLSEAFLI